VCIVLDKCHDSETHPDNGDESDQPEHENPPRALHWVLGLISESLGCDVIWESDAVQELTHRGFVLVGESGPGLVYVFGNLGDQLFSTGPRECMERAVEAKEIVGNDAVYILSSHGMAPPSIKLSTASRNVRHWTWNVANAKRPSFVSR